MPDLPQDIDPADRDPRERGLQRCSGNASVSPWLIVFVIALIAAGTYVAMTLL